MHPLSCLGRHAGDVCVLVPISILFQPGSAVAGHSMEVAEAVRREALGHAKRGVAVEVCDEAGRMMGIVEPRESGFGVCVPDDQGVLVDGRLNLWGLSIP